MTTIQSPDTTSFARDVSIPTDSSSDLYQIHIQCNVGVSDDYGGTVYIGAFETGYGPVDTMDETLKTNIIELLTTNQGVPNFPFTASKDVPVPAIGIANVAFQDASSSSSSPNPMEINIDYSVYVMVVDNNGNPSELFYGQRGRIDPQAPPIIEVTQVTTDTSGFTVNVHAELRSTVEFKAKYLLSSQNVADPLSLEDIYFEDATIFNAVGGAVYETENIEQTRANVDHSFVKVVNDTVNPTDYDPWIDLTKDLYLYAYVTNFDPHLKSNVARTTIGRAFEPKSDIDVSIETHNPRDTTAEIRFRVHDAANTTYYVALFDQSYNTGANVNGLLKEHVIGVPETMRGTLPDTNLAWITLNKYYTELGNLNSIASIQTQQTYYAYMLVRDPVTYQYSDFRTITVTTGSAPRVLRSTGRFNLANVDAGDTENTIYVTANIEEENGGNVYGALIVRPELTPSDISLLDSSVHMDVLADSLPNPSNSFVSRKFTHAYANIDAYQNGIQSNIETDTTYFVYFVMTDTLNNQQKLHLKQGVFQTSADVETADDNVIDPGTGTGDFEPTDPAGPAGPADPDDPPTVTVDANIAIIPISFYNGHKVFLESIVLDLSASTCTDVDSVKIYASNTKDEFTETDLLELNLSQDLAAGEPESVYKINNITTTDDIGKETRFSFYRIVLQRSGSHITIVGIDYNILVHDDRGPELSNLSASHNGGTNAAVMEFTVADFSNVEATMFMSRYEYGITEELEDMHKLIFPKTQYTGPPQHFLDGQDANITSNVVYIDPSKDPMETDDYNSDDFDQYYFYIYSKDTGKSNESSFTYTKVNPTNRADVTASPVISDRTVDPMFVDSLGDTAIRVTANISQPFIDYTPFKYKHFAVRTGLSPPTTIPYGEYQFSNISNHVTYLRTTVTGDPIQEGDSKYDVYTYAISGAGYSVSEKTQQPVSLPSNKPTVSIDKLQTAADGVIRLEFSFSDEFAAVDVYAGLFAKKPANVANFFQSPAIMPDFQNANIGSNIVDFTTAYSYSNPDTDPTANVDVNTTEGSYYVIVYARETNTESNLESQTEAVYGFTMGQQSAEDLANVNGQEGNISTDTIDDIEVILLENDSTVLKLPFVTSEDPDVITITGLFYPTSSDKILPKPEATLFTLGDYRLVVRENDQLAVVHDTEGTTTEKFSLNTNIKLSLQEYNTVVFVIDKVLNEIEVGIGIQDVVTANVDIDSIGNITGQISAGPFLGGLADIKASEEHMPPPTVLTQIDVLPPKITVDLANVVRSTVNEFMFPVGTFEIEDSYPSNVSIGLFDAFYGDPQPFAGVYANLRTTLLTSGEAKQFTNLLSGAERSTALDEFVLTHSHASVDGSLSSNVVDENYGTYHIYAFVEDTQTPTPNETIRYCGVLYGNVTQDEVENTLDPILDNPTFYPNSDKQIYNITVEGSNVDSVYFAAYPASMSFKYETRNNIKAQMQTYGTQGGLKPSATTLSDGYFADDKATSLTPFEYNQDYFVYALGVNATTGKTVLSENGLIANTALAPVINSVTSSSVFYSSTNTTTVTVTIEIEEQSAANVYVALFDTPQNEAAVIRFFEGAEFVNETNVRHVLSHSSEGHGITTTHQAAFTYIHTNALFYDSDVRIHGSHKVYAYAYVKNTEYDAYNTAFGNVDANVMSYTDYKYNEYTNIQTIMETKDASFTAMSRLVGLNTLDWTEPISISSRFRVAAFTSEHSPIDLISFFQDTSTSHIHESNIDYTIDTNVIFPSVILFNAVTLPRLNANVPVTTVSGDYQFFGSDTELILLKGRTYYFDQSDGSNDGHPIYFKRPLDGSEFTDGVTYVVDDETYSNVDGYQTNFKSTPTRYVRFDVPTTPPGDIPLYYQCITHTGMNGSVTLKDDPTEPIAVSTKTQEPNTTYRIYSFVEDDTPRKNTAVSAVQSRQTGAPPTVVFDYAAFITETS